ncbi:MAG: hypothetical protein Q9184_005498, partial [Pyrenodesmia sp. 2 TL-2023]
MYPILSNFEITIADVVLKFSVRYVTVLLSTYVLLSKDEVEVDGGCQPVNASHEIYYPVFHLIEPPAEYSAEFESLSKDIIPWLAINSSIPPLSEALSKLKTQLTEINPTPYPFLNNTVPQVYAFFKNHIRQPEEAICGHSLAHFTFLAVDAQCVWPSSPPPEPLESRYSTGSNFTVLVCTDAPDFHEGDNEPRLKTLRLPIAAAFQRLEQLDELVITASEMYTRTFENQDAMNLRLMPPACLYPIPPYTDDLDEQVYKLGSYAQMRERKKQ